MKELIDKKVQEFEELFNSSDIILARIKGKVYIQIGNETLNLSNLLKRAFTEIANECKDIDNYE